VCTAWHSHAPFAAHETTYDLLQLRQWSRRHVCCCWWSAALAAGAAPRAAAVVSLDCAAAVLPYNDKLGRMSNTRTPIRCAASAAATAASLCVLARSLVCLQNSLHLDNSTRICNPRSTADSFNLLSAPDDMIQSKAPDHWFRAPIDSHRYLIVSIDDCEYGTGTDGAVFALSTRLTRCTLHTPQKTCCAAV